MGVVFTNNAETTLAAAISSTSATSISVTSSSSFPSIAAGEYFYATVDDGTNHEIVKVTGISGTTWTVVRAADNSTARTIANGSTVQLRATAALLTDIQENIAAKSANQTLYNATTASNATAYDIGINPGVEGNAMVFLNGLMQHHNTFSFSGSTLTFDAAPTNGMALEVIVDNLINLQSSNLTTDTFTATSGQTAFVLSDAPAAENNLIVFIDGVFQDQSNYSISDHTLTLATGAVQGRTVTIYIINPVNIGTPSDGTVTTSKLSGNITMPGTLTVGAFDVAFDSPTFFVDNSNSRVGLGTATPSVPVDIVGEVKISSHLTLGTTSKVQFGDSGTYIHQSADGVLDLVSDTEIEINATTIDVNGALDVSGAITGILATAAQTNITSVGTLTALTGGTGDLNWDSGTLFVDSSANAVGIGTTSPSAKIHATTATAGYTAKLINTNGATDANGLLIQAGTASSEYALNVSNTAGNTSFMVVKGDGNVGIGNSTPSNNHANANNLVVGNGTAGGIANYVGTGLGWYAFSRDNANNTDAYDGGMAYDGSRNLTFHTNAGATRMTIDGSGNVGIGKSPDNFFHIHKGASGSGTQNNAITPLVIENSTHAMIQFDTPNNVQAGFYFGDPQSAVAGELAYEHANNRFHFYTAGASKMQINSTGQVLANSLGTTTPTFSFINDPNTGMSRPTTDALNFCTAGAERMRIDSSGRVGIGVTDTVGRELCVKGEVAAISTGSTDTHILMGASDSIVNIAATYSSSGSYVPIAFETSGQERMRIDSSGNVGIGGTPASGRNLHVHGIIRVQNTQNANYPVMEFFNTNGQVGGIRTSNSVTSYDTSSDYRLKENVEPIPNGLARVQQLNPVKFDWKVDGTSSEGFIAHEVQEIFPDAVGGEKDGEEMQSMDYGKITPLLVKAIQEQQALIESLTARITTLENA